MNEPSNPTVLLDPVSPETLLPDCGLWPWFAAAGAAILIAIILLIVLRKRNNRPNPEALRNAAFTDAATALANVTTESCRDAAIQSSLILRKYLAVTTGDPALFETHEEFISRHDALHALTPDARAAAESGFTRLAALKYAPEIPDAVPTDVITDSRTLLETLHQGFPA